MRCPVAGQLEHPDVASRMEQSMAAASYHLPVMDTQSASFVEPSKKGYKAHTNATADNPVVASTLRVVVKVCEVRGTLIVLSALRHGGCGP